MSTIAPERSLDQRREALVLANSVRLWRAEQKRRLKAGEALLVDVLWCEDDRLGSMKVYDLLDAVPGMGPCKVGALLTRCRISFSKSVDGMTERQWDELFKEMGRSTPAVRRCALGY